MIVVIEEKADYKSVGDEVQQAKEYAEILVLHGLLKIGI